MRPSTAVQRIKRPNSCISERIRSKSPVDNLNQDKKKKEKKTEKQKVKITLQEQVRKELL